jgi:hypothetical protein
MQITSKTTNITVPRQRFDEMRDAFRRIGLVDKTPNGVDFKNEGAPNMVPGAPTVRVLASDLPQGINFMVDVLDAGSRLGHIVFSKDRPVALNRDGKFVTIVASEEPEVLVKRIETVAKAMVELRDMETQLKGGQSRQGRALLALDAFDAMDKAANAIPTGPKEVWEADVKTATQMRDYALTDTVTGVLKSFGKHLAAASENVRRALDFTL